MSFICVNGHFLPHNSAILPADNRGFLLGDGVFETIRIADARLQHVDRHFKRLFHGMETLRFPQLDRDALKGQMEELLHRNVVVEGALRLTVTRSAGSRGLVPLGDVSSHYVISTHDAMQSSESIRLTIARFPKEHFSPLAAIKHTNYLPAILARIEAADEGYDDAIFLNTAGRVAEASASNILALFGNRLLTPPVQDGALPGISRARLLESGLCAEGSLTMPMLLEAHALWLCSSLRLMTVSCIDRHIVSRDARRHDQLTAFLFGQN